MNDIAREIARKNREWAEAKTREAEAKIKPENGIQRSWHNRRPTRHQKVREELPTIEALIDRLLCRSAEGLEAETQVYLLRHADSGRIKIGKSRDVESRLGQIRTASPVDGIEVVCWWPETWLSEGRLHDWFAPERLHGEWFHGPDIERFTNEAEWMLEPQ